MLRQEIKISVLSIDEGDDTIQFQIEVSNGISSTSQDFYGYTDNFKEFATGLLAFPKTITDKVKYELGESGERWAYYILLDVFCFENNGQSAVHILIDNNCKRPYTNKSEFYITTVPASLNKLGQLLNDWQPMTENKSHGRQNDKARTTNSSYNYKKYSSDALSPNVSSRQKDLKNFPQSI